MEVVADSWHLGDRGDPERRKLVGAADPRQHQELWRSERACTEDHLTAMDLLHRAVPQRPHAGRARAVEEHPERVGVGAHLEVRAIGHRADVGRRRALAPPVALGHLPPADTVLRRAVEVVVRGEPRRERCVDERLGVRVARSAVGDRVRATDAVIGVGAAIVVLAALPVRQQLVVAPARAPGVAPRVVVPRQAAEVDHPVERRGPAEDAPPRLEDATPVEVRLVRGRVVPIDVGAQERRPRARDVDQLGRVRRACLEQQHRARGILAQPVRQDAARRPCTNDDEVVHQIVPLRCGQEATIPTRPVRKNAS